MKRRILLYGGPCCGKSTVATKLFSDLKSQGLNIEFAREFVKHWTYNGRKYHYWDQPLLFAQQIQEEFTPLNSGVDLVVSESPILLNSFYGFYHKSPVAKHLLNMAIEFEHEYPGIHIFLNRSDNKEEFKQHGRFHNYEESVNIDKDMKHYLIDAMTKLKGPTLFSVKYNNYSNIINILKKGLPNENIHS